MLQYLLNTTLIWLACLLFFDLMLRRETYHHYNRIYLVASLLLGLLLPFWKWNDNSVISKTVLQPPVERMHHLQQAVVSNSLPVENEFAFSLILWYVYLTGIVVAMLFIVKEIFQLLRLYNNGARSNDGNWTIVETGKDHSPFSFLKIIFIKSREDYNEEQWQLLFLHEQQHGKLLHSLDKTFMVLLRILFWFHPLVYVYYKRLMIVHEYQADAVAKNRQQLYGTFLLEQSLLQQAPLFVHSFNYSPVKNRIVMLTRKTSSRLHLSKYFLALPVVFALTLCCTSNSFSHEKIRRGNKIVFKGNEFELKGYSQDTVMVEDPMTGEIMYKVIKRDSVVIKMNGKEINRGGTAGTPTFIGGVSIEEFIFRKLLPELNKLRDGEKYFIRVSNLIIDEKGKVVFYDIWGIGSNENSISQEIKDAIVNKLTEIFDGDIRFKPAIINGKPVISSLYPDLDFYNRIIVKDHKAVLKEKKEESDPLRPVILHK